MYELDRVVSAVIMSSVTLFSAHCGEVAFGILKVAVAVAAASEFYHLATLSALKRPTYGHGQCGHPSYLLNALVVIVPSVFLHKSLMMSIEDHMYVFAIVWASDTAALLIGRLCAAFEYSNALTDWSPQKTLQGLYGALFFGTLCGTLYLYNGDPTGFSGPSGGGHNCIDSGLNNGAGPGTSGFGCLLKIVGRSFAISAASQLGDFLESVLKRHCGIKDSNFLFNIPGHGGILDRIDGLIVAIIIQ